VQKGGRADDPKEKKRMSFQHIISAQLHPNLEFLGERKLKTSGYKRVHKRKAIKKEKGKIFRVALVHGAGI